VSLEFHAQLVKSGLRTSNGRPFGYASSARIHSAAMAASLGSKHT
jgi:hypothetical protein